jgi:hypothetical protein
MLSGIFRDRLWNQTIPGRLRGRLAGVEMLSYSVGPSAGQLRAVGVVRLALPAFWNFSSRRASISPAPEPLAR